MCAIFNYMYQSARFVKWATLQWGDGFKKYYYCPYNLRASMNLFLISIGVKSMIGAFELPDSVL